MRLARRDPSIGIQNHHAHTGLAMKRGGHGGAGIAGGGDQDGQRRLLRRRSLYALQLLETRGQKACAEIFERRAGAMEQFQCRSIGASRQPTQWRIEIEGLCTDRWQCGGQRTVGEEGGKQGRRRAGQVGFGIECRRIEARQRLGYIKAAVCRESGSDGFIDTYGRMRAAGAVVKQRLGHASASVSIRCAAGPSMGDTRTSLGRPASANAAAMAVTAACASSRFSYQPNTLGPPPEMLAPRA